MAEIFVALIGLLIALYVASRWLLVFVQWHSWLESSVAMLALALLAIGLWLRLRWCGYLLAAAASTMAAVAASGHIDLLLPP